MRKIYGLAEAEQNVAHESFKLYPTTSAER
jgi:hypothetical protein